MAVALAVLTVSGIVYAQERGQDKSEESNFSRSIPSPTTPEGITPPAGSSAFLVGRGVETQVFFSLPHPDGGSSRYNENVRTQGTLLALIFRASISVTHHFIIPDVYQAA